jgi:propanediol dehydratase large subunit
VSIANGACLPAERRSARYEARAARDVRREVLIEPLAELGLVAFDGPNDPAPSLVIEDGRIIELDGRRREDWDALDHFIAGSGLDLDVAREAAELDDAEIARRLVDVAVSRAERPRTRRT